MSLWWVYGIVILLISDICLAENTTDNNTTDNNQKNNDNDWWKTAVIYQLYPMSFKDSDGDGIGDLKGITSEVDYLANTGIDAIWICPIFKSPMTDFGYDISHYKMIDPKFGTIEDFNNLRKVTQEKDIKLLLDFVPNHSSDQHEWFLKSAMNDTQYQDYYIWANGRILQDTYERLPPNNWLSAFGGSAWTWNEDRGQYYLHQHLSSQPDLNLRNPNVTKELEDVMTFWLEKGVDGFRIDATSFLFEDRNLTHEERTSDKYAQPGNYSALNHSHTFNLLDNHELVAQWRKFVDEYSRKDGKTRLIFSHSSGNFKDVIAYTGNKTNPEAHFPINVDLIYGISNQSKVQDIKSIIDTWMVTEAMNWVTGNHDEYRVATRLGKEMVDIMNILHLMLPGTAITYYGEEIGMEDTLVNWEDAKDPLCFSAGRKNFASLCRDFHRSPFQWDGTDNAGFSTGNKTWLSVNANYKELNLKKQMTADTSNYKTYKQLVHARKEPAIKKGNLNFKTPNDDILTFSRELDGHDSFVIIINLGKTLLPMDLSIYDTMKGNFKVYASSINSPLVVDSSVNNSVILNPNEAVVLVTSSHTPKSQSYNNKGTSYSLDSTILLLVTTLFALSSYLISL